MDEYVFVDRESVNLWAALNVLSTNSTLLKNFVHTIPSIKFVHIYFQLIVPTIVRGG